MRSDFLLGAAALCLLAACGDDAREAVPDAVPDRAPAEVIAVPTPEANEASAGLPQASVSDVLGTFEGEVAGLALWEHPVMSFASAVLAANGTAGLAVVPVDTEVEGRVIEGTFDGPVAVGYTDEASFVAAASGGEVLLFAGDDDAAFTPIGSVTAEADALCMIGSTLLVVGAEATGYAVDPDGTAQTLFSLPGGNGAFCGTTDERFYVLVPGQPLRSVDASGANAMVDDTYARARPQGFAVAATPEGRAFVVLEGGALSVDGPGVPRTQVEVVRDGGAAPAPDVIAAGSGNFGSLYRDGVVAMVAGGELMLLPWAGVARAAGLEGTQTVSLRPAEDPMPTPAIDLQLPEIETTLGPSED